VGGKLRFVPRNDVQTSLLICRAREYLKSLKKLSVCNFPSEVGTSFPELAMYYSVKNSWSPLVIDAICVFVLLATIFIQVYVGVKYSEHVCTELIYMYLSATKRQNNF